SFTSLVHPEDLPKAITAFKNILSGEKLEPYELRILTKLGEYKIGEFSPSALMSGDKIIGVLGIARDITERKRIEEELKKSYEKTKELEVIINRSQAVAFLWRAEENWPIEYVSKNISQFGYTPDELLSGALPFAKMVYPEDLERVAEEVSHYSQTGAAEFDQEYRIVTKSGDVRWIDDQTFVRRDQNNKITHYQGIISDITERKRAEKKLKESERKLSTLIGNLPGMAYRCLMDRDWTMKYVSQGCVELTGYEPDDFIDNKKLSFNDIIREDYRDSLWHKWQDVLKSQEVFRDEYPITTADGNQKWVWEQGCGIYSDTGEVIALEGFITDITERKKAQQDVQEALQLSEQSRHALLTVLEDQKITEEKIKRYSEELATLLKISQELATTLNLSTILQMTTDRITELTELKSSAIYLLKGETLRLWATTPPLPPQFPEELRDAPLADHPHIRKAITTGMPVFLPDTATADLTPAERAVCEMRGLRSILYVPLLAGTKVLGTLIVTATEKPRVFSDAEINLCSTLANLAALTVSNAQLYESEQHYAADLEQRIIELKQAEEIILKANRVYAVISQINQAIVRINSEDKLFEECCRIAIDFGKFQMAWIGLVDETTKLVKPITFAGVEDGYLTKSKKISVSDVPEGRGPTGTAIREGKYFVCDDIENDPCMAAWKDEALKRGYRSSIDLPIKLSGKVIGAFSLYAPTPHFFDQKEIDLLDEVTNDISYALQAIETEKKRKEAEEELRQSENRFHAAFENAATGMSLNAPEGNFIQVNKALCRMLGYLSDELINATLAQITHPDDISLSMKSIARSVEEKEDTHHFEKRYLRKNGDVVWAEISSSLLRGTKGEPLYFINQIIDISERKRAEEALQESESRFRRLAENAQDMIYRMSLPDGKYEYVSSAAATIFGYTPEEFYNTPVLIQKAIHPDWHKYFEEQWANLIKGEILPTYEYQIIRKSGEVRWLNQRNILVCGDSGNPIAIEGIVTDITERQQAVAALRALSSHQEAILAAVPDIVMEVDNNKVYTWANPSGLAFFGEDVIGKDASFYFEGEQDTYSMVKPLFFGAENVIYVESWQRRKDGQKRLLAWWCRVLKDESGNVTGALSSAQDITERKLAEEALRESEERWQFALEGPGDGVWDWDAQTNKVFFSHQWKAMIGYDDNEIGNELNEWEKRVHPEDIDYVHNEINKHFNGEIPLYLSEHRMMCKDGTYKWILDRGKVISRSEYGKPLRVIGTHTDITERKRAKQASKQAEEEIKLTNKELEIINKTIVTSASTLDLTTILDKVMDEAIRVVGLEGGTICLINPDDTFDLAVERGASQETIEDLSKHKIKIGDCLCGNCAKECKPLILQTKEAVLEYATREVLRGEDIRFHAAFPFVVGEKCVGVLCAFTRTDLKPTDRSLKLLETIVAQTAIAIENARLYEEIKENVKILQQEILNRKKSTSEIQRMNEQLRAFATRLQTIREEERTSIAREIHDELGQMLTGLKYELMWIEKRVLPVQNEIRNKVKDIQGIIDSIIKTVRKISAELRPGILDLGLAAAIEWQTKEFRRRTGTPGITDIDDASVQISENTSTQVFRIFQEILTNIMRHANASNVDIVLKPIKNNFILTVSDNGKGMQPDTKPDERSLGLLGMQERTIIFGGSLSIKSAANKGTTIEISIPFEHSTQ
ncbi:MAG: hypothetical protein C0417_12790, partial [Chlorobiaceae bacterium]|nr:hypothetical protein [Chlorobiaceae bacterium]